MLSNPHLPLSLPQHSVFTKCSQTVHQQDSAVKVLKDLTQRVKSMKKSRNCLSFFRTNDRALFQLNKELTLINQGYAPDGNIGKAIENALQWYLHDVSRKLDPNGETAALLHDYRGLIKDNKDKKLRKTFDRLVTKSDQYKEKGKLEKAKVYMLRAALLCDEQGREPDTGHLYHEFEELCGISGADDAIGLTKVAKTYAEFGVRLEQDGQHERAVRVYLRATAKLKDSFPAAAAFFYKRMGNQNEARACYAMAVSQHGVGEQWRAEAALEANGREDKSLLSAEQLDPNSPVSKTAKQNRTVYHTIDGIFSKFEFHDKPVLRNAARLEIEGDYEAAGDAFMQAKRLVDASRCYRSALKVIIRRPEHEEQAAAVRRDGEVLEEAPEARRPPAPQQKPSQVTQEREEQAEAVSGAHVFEENSSARESSAPQPNLQYECTGQDLDLATQLANGPASGPDDSDSDTSEPVEAQTGQDQSIDGAVDPKLANLSESKPVSPYSRPEQPRLHQELQRTLDTLMSNEELPDLVQRYEELASLQEKLQAGEEPVDERHQLLIDLHTKSRLARMSEQTIVSYLPYLSQHLVVSAPADPASVEIKNLYGKLAECAVQQGHHVMAARYYEKAEDFATAAKQYLQVADIEAVDMRDKKRLTFRAAALYGKAWRCLKMIPEEDQRADGWVAQVGNAHLQTLYWHKRRAEFCHHQHYYDKAVQSYWEMAQHFQIEEKAAQAAIARREQSPVALREAQSMARKAKKRRNEAIIEMYDCIYRHRKYGSTGPSIPYRDAILEPVYL